MMKEARFNLERRKDKAGNVITTNVPIRLSFFFDGKRLEYYSGVRVTNELNFNEKYYKKGLPILKVNEPEAGRKNKILKDLKNKVEAEYDKAIALNIQPTPEYLKYRLDELIKGKVTNTEKPSISEAFRMFMKDTESSKSKGTYARIKTTYTHLENAFGKKFSGLTFADLTSSFVEKFRAYFINNGFETKNGKQNFQFNTVVKYVRCLREFINWCADEKRQYHSGKVNYGDLEEKEINIIYLTDEEIDQVARTGMPNEALARVKDVFLFGCYSGMRYGDTFKLRKKDIINGNILRFYIEKKKAGDWHTVPLVEQTIEIIEKYKHIDGAKALPVISNQKMNEYIKKVMQISGINEQLTIREFKADGSFEEKEYKKWELITCHTSRKSFISYVVASGMPEIEIKAITGHSKNSRAFGRYYEIPIDQKQKSMNKIFKKKKATKLLKAV
jgi:integrase